MALGNGFVTKPLVQRLVDRGPHQHTHEPVRHQAAGVTEVDRIVENVLVPGARLHLADLQCERIEAGESTGAGVHPPGAVVTVPAALVWTCCRRFPTGS